MIFTREDATRIATLHSTSTGEYILFHNRRYIDELWTCKMIYVTVSWLQVQLNTLFMPHPAGHQAGLTPREDISLTSSAIWTKKTRGRRLSSWSTLTVTLAVESGAHYRCTIELNASVGAMYWRVESSSHPLRSLLCSTECWHRWYS